MISRVLSASSVPEPTLRTTSNGAAASTGPGIAVALVIGSTTRTGDAVGMHQTMRRRIAPAAGRVTVDRKVTAGSERRLQKHRDAAADDRCKRRSQIPSINAEPHPPRRCNANVLDESEWRQRFDVGRHRGAILGAQLRSIVYDLHHWPTYPVAVRRHAGRIRPRGGLRMCLPELHRAERRDDNCGGEQALVRMVDYCSVVFALQSTESPGA